MRNMDLVQISSLMLGVTFSNMCLHVMGKSVQAEIKFYGKKYYAVKLCSKPESAVMYTEEDLKVLAMELLDNIFDDVIINERIFKDEQPRKDSKPAKDRPNTARPRKESTKHAVKPLRRRK